MRGLRKRVSFAIFARTDDLERVTRLDVTVVWLGVRAMHNKWASCSTNGHLDFNTELLAYDEPV